MGCRESGLRVKALARQAGLSVSHVLRVMGRQEGVGEEKDKT